MDDVRGSYDRLAAKYAERIYDELRHKPFDREQLARLAAASDGPVCDLGCGPGHVARLLAELGADAFGVDISPQMVATARELNPGLEFREGDMRALDIPDGSLGGVAAFYSIIHVGRDQLAGALGEILRVLRPGGVLLAAFHLGDETVHLDELWDERVDVDFHFYGSAEMATALAAAGFVVDEVLERDPYPPEVEHQSRRAYIFAHRPLSGGGV
jgi:SAM-dependent methyltransferase